MTRLLLLAGTAEARQLAEHLVQQPDIDLITSLAGATQSPLPYPGTVRRKGFGGVEGFRNFLQEQGITAVIDATHPFAQRISATAASVTADVHLPLLRLERPAWVAAPADRWQSFVTVATALAGLPRTATALVATGASTGQMDLPTGPALILRSIDQLTRPWPANVDVLLARPPFSLEAEIALLRERSVTHLVCKNSGGASGRAKLDAAGQLGLTVHIVQRPTSPKPTPTTVATARQAGLWAANVAKRGPPAAARA